MISIALIILFFFPDGNQAITVNRAFDFKPIDGVLTLPICDTSVLYEGLGNPKEEYCDVSHSSEIPTNKKDFEVYIKDKSDNHVFGYKCSLMHYEVKLAGYLTGGGGYSKQVKRSVSDEECFNAPLREDPGPPIESANLFTDLYTVQEDILVKEEMIMAIDNFDKMIIPGVNKRPDFHKGFFSDNQNTYIWDKSFIDSEYTFQGIYSCYHSSTEYICPDSKLVFHRSTSPHFIKVAKLNVVLEKTLEGIYIRNDESEPTVEDTTDGSQESLRNSQLEYIDHLMAQNTMMIELIQKITNCLNRNFVIRNLADHKYLTLDLSEEIYRVKDKLVVDTTGSKYYNCTRKQVFKYATNGESVYFSISDGSLYEYDCYKHVLVTEGHAECRPPLDSSLFSLGTDQILTLKEKPIVISIREEYKRRISEKETEEIPIGKWKHLRNIVKRSEGSLFDWTKHMFYIKSVFLMVLVGVALLTFLVFVTKIYISLYPAVGKVTKYHPTIVNVTVDNVDDDDVSADFRE